VTVLTLLSMVALGATGTWHGELQRDDHTWRAIVHVEATAGDTAVRVSFPDFGMFQLETHHVVVGDSTLELGTVWIESGFRGRITGELLDGTWTFGNAPARARFHRASPAPRILRTEDLTVEMDDGAELAARLILPHGEPPYPAMVLTHGSGPDVRSTGPYLSKANLAALHGVLVLIWDKRGAGASTGDGGYRIERLAADASRMLDHLRADPRVDPARIGIGGISQGGWVAPMVASANPEIAFVFGTAIPGVSPAEQNVFCLRTRLEGAGFDDAAVRDAVRTLRTIYEYYRGGDEARRLAAERRLERADPAWADTDLFRRFLFWPGDHLPDDVDPADYATMFVDPLSWWREITAPVLGLWGEEDGNVPATYSCAVVSAALDDAGNRDRRLVVVPRAGHGLSRTDGAEDDWPRAGPGVVEIMAAWFEQR